MSAWLEIEDGPEAGKRIDIPVDAEDIVLGRSPDCGGVVAAPSVSRKHACLKREGGRFRIEDLGSANGTFVNGERLERPVELNDQDRISLGAVKILFVNPPPPPEPEGDATIAITPSQAPRDDATIVRPAPPEPAPPPKAEPPPPPPRAPEPPPPPPPAPETKPSPPPEPPPPRPHAPEPPRPAPRPASVVQTTTTKLPPSGEPGMLELVAIAVGSFLAVFGLGWWLL